MEINMTYLINIHFCINFCSA